jgi:DNA repair exonuclease SbcCD ATPase subunit
MRLLSASVKNYRIHGDVSVEFSDSLTLIGGKNETGKSTLTEAIHRALFLKATTGGQLQKSMQSAIHPGHPEVEVRFEAAGTVWHLKKVFSKTSGKATLSEEGRVALQGADAEARLSELMQVEEPAGGKGGANKALSQWAHLWVWQGSGGEDPTEHAASQKDALLSRLKEHGGGAVMQSDLDSRVANLFQEECDTFFTKGGQIKAGSDLARAETEKEEAEAALERAGSALARLESAARDYQDAEAILQGGEKHLSELAKQAEEARAKTSRVTELRHREELENRSVKEAREALEKFQRAREEVTKLESEVSELKAKAKPGAETLEQLEAAVKRKRTALEAAIAGLDAAESALSKRRETRELAEAWEHLLKNREERSGLEKDAADIQQLEEEQKSLEEKLAALPAIDEATHRALQQAEARASETRAVLEAMSTELEVLESGQTITAGEDELEKGSRITLDRTTDLHIGTSVHLKITPGGGANLDDAREAAREHRASRDAAFRNAGVQTLDEAGEIRGQRAALESQLQELLANLRQRDRESLDHSLKETAHHIAIFEGEVQRRSASLPDFAPPESFPEARALRESIRDELGPLESALSGARQTQAAARSELEKAEHQRDQEKAKIAATSQELIETSALLKAKREPLGTVEERNEKEQALTQSLQEFRNALTKTRDALAALQPDALEADLSRLQRAIDVKKGELEQAGQTRAVARSILTLDGTIDPAAAVASARARAESAGERFRSLNRRAEAIRLLRDRFAEEQQKLSDRFSQPLAEKVSGYLKQIFGPSASAGVSVQDGVIGGWTMSRETGTFEFSDLSGGTREQVAAAVRLALAEILAEDHGGSLPLVFDDAFTNSDPSRIQSLQRMLDLAARNGLQIILLTCDPDDYAGLGAKTVSLNQAQSLP